MTGAPDVDVVVVGDGPAGLALARSCHELGVPVLVVGPGNPWTNTYGVWVDEFTGDAMPGALDERCLATVTERVVAYGNRRHDLDRAYGIVDNDVLQRNLGDGIDLLRAEASAVVERRGLTEVQTSSGVVSARRVVDATGSGALLAGSTHDSGRPRDGSTWQTAYGIVIDQIPDGASVERGAVTLMDFRPPPGPGDTMAVPTFCYVVPVAGGWLVEETVLAARPAVEPSLLRTRLARRLGSDGEELVASAARVEQVRIAMGGPLPEGGGAAVAFGAAAGYVHPATGFSLAASVRAAPRVARALCDCADPWAAVWPSAARRSRVLHDYGADVMLRMDPEQLRQFFDVFFEQPMRVWAAYLRIDTAPAELARSMARVFAGAPWSLRRRLMSGDPRGWLRVIRP